jgi:hypothetical protein
MPSPLSSRAPIYEVFPLICPTCQEPLTFIALPPLTAPTATPLRRSPLRSGPLPTPSPFLKTTSFRAAVPDP